MFKIEKATAEDFEKIYPFLQKLNSRDLSEEDWRNIFIQHWESPEDFCGLMLVKDGEVKGFLGLIFSSRIFNNEIYKFCNISSWIVDEDSRSQSLFMLLEALKLKDYTFTCFSASPTSVAPVLSKLGFKGFEVNQQVLPAMPNLLLQGRGYTCEFNLRKIRERLNETERVIFDDHQNLGCAHLLLKSDKGYAYVVLKNTRRRNIPLAKVHYISDAGHFAQGIEKFVLKICLRLKVLGIMVDERYLEGRQMRKSIRYPQQRKAYFKSNSKTLDENQIDTLYSEMVVLYHPKVAA